VKYFIRDFKAVINHGLVSSEKYVLIKFGGLAHFLSKSGEFVEKP
jgi:hypothetical protein